MPDHIHLGEQAADVLKDVVKEFVVGQPTDQVRPNAAIACTNVGHDVFSFLVRYDVTQYGALIFVLALSIYFYSTTTRAQGKREAANIGLASARDISKSGTAKPPVIGVSISTRRAPQST